MARSVVPSALMLASIVGVASANTAPRAPKPIQKAEGPRGLAALKSILVVGDGFAQVAGDAPGPSTMSSSFLERNLKAHGCDAKVSSIAIPGTTAAQWTEPAKLAQLKKGAKVSDYVFITLGEIDAMTEMPGCASKGKTSAQCGDELISSLKKNLGIIVGAIHEANPKAQVVGSGYDTMFGGPGSSLVTRRMLPQCWSDHHKGKENRCFNTQFVRIQHDVWDSLAQKFSWVDTADILGATQAAAGNSRAKLGGIDMDAMGPAQYWPDYQDCAHPSVSGGNAGGAMVLMEAFHKVYWSSRTDVCTSPRRLV